MTGHSGSRRRWMPLLSCPQEIREILTASRADPKPNGWSVMQMRSFRLFLRAITSSLMPQRRRVHDFLVVGSRSSVIPGKCADPDFWAGPPWGLFSILLSEPPGAPPFRTGSGFRPSSWNNSKHLSGAHRSEKGKGALRCPVPSSMDGRIIADKGNRLADTPPKKPTTPRHKLYGRVNYKDLHSSYPARDGCLMTLSTSMTVSPPRANGTIVASGWRQAVTSWAVGKLWMMATRLRRSIALQQ